MRLQHSGYLLHRLQAAAQGPSAPALEKSSSPGRRLVGPEMMEGLLQSPCPRRSQFAGQQGVELLAGKPTHTAPLAQQRPTHILQLLAFFLARGTQAGTLSAAHLVHRLVHVLGDVESIEHMQRMAGLGGNHIEVRLPHVAAYKPQTFYKVWSKLLQPQSKRLLRAPLADPKQPFAPGIDLVDDGQKVIRLHAVSPVNLVHPDGFNAAQYAVWQAILHKPLHRTIDRLPTGSEHRGRLAPAEPSRPAGKKPHHGRGHWTFSRAPGNVFHHHPMLATLDPARRIDKMGRYPPQGHKLPAALGKPVIARRWLPAVRTASLDAAMGRHCDRDLQLAVIKYAHP